MCVYVCVHAYREVYYSSSLFSSSPLKFVFSHLERKQIILPVVRWKYDEYQIDEVYAWGEYLEILFHSRRAVILFHHTMPSSIVEFDELGNKLSKFHPRRNKYFRYHPRSIFFLPCAKMRASYSMF